MYNKVILIGHLGKDTEPRYMQDGESGVLNFTVATNRSWRDKDGNWQTDTQWHNIVFWRNRGLESLSARLRKGTLAMIEGEIQHRQWEDKNGDTHYITEIRAYKVIPLEKRGDRDTASAPAGNPDDNSNSAIPPANEGDSKPETEDDLPF